MRPTPSGFFGAFHAAWIWSPISLSVDSLTGPSLFFSTHRLPSLVDGDHGLHLVLLLRVVRRLRQLDVVAAAHDQRHQHEDDEQHEHDVDERRHVDVVADRIDVRLLVARQTPAAVR